MRKWLIPVLLVILLSLTLFVFRNQIQKLFRDTDHMPVAKPVIYLYPEEETEVHVKLDYQGELVCTYPQSVGEWTMIAQPDGTLTDPVSGREYSYLFWEGVSDTEYNLSEGYVVPGKETAPFLQTTLAAMGLTPREYNEFIVYWLPLMQDNPYNLITFQQEAYTDSAPLKITPEPDRILRVFMVFKPLNAPIDIPAPAIEPFERSGFTVIEWGGTALSSLNAHR